jgi:GT2 family glycosyltransferase
MNSTATVLDSEPFLIPTVGKILCVILSFNGFNDTISCIQSIVDQKQSGFDLLVIDNGSSAGTVDSIVAAFPSVEVISLSENLGWAGGNNFGIKLALERGYDWVCLLNNDTVFPEGEVANWINAIRTAPPCLLHPVIHYWDNPEEAQITILGQVNGKPNRQAALWKGKILMEHAYGACLAIPREIFESVGFLDERLFLQLEETDFHRRSMQKGYHAACDPLVKIFHKESKSFGGVRAPIKIYYTIRNSLLLIEKTPAPFKQKLRSLKELYWTIAQIACSAYDAQQLGKMALIRWMISTAPSATAVRVGIADYMLRRFGRISARRHSHIKAMEAKAVIRKYTADAG